MPDYLLDTTLQLRPKKQCIRVGRGFVNGIRGRKVLRQTHHPAHITQKTQLYYRTEMSSLRHQQIRSLRQT